MILAGDVGGTKIHLALYSFADGRLRPVRDEIFPAQEFPSLDATVEKFLGDSGSGAARGTKATTEILTLAGQNDGGLGNRGERSQIVAACFGCPGPVREGRIKLTNLPWSLSEQDLEKSLGIEHIFLINDLEANGYGIPELAADQIVTLHEGADATAVGMPVGNRGLIAAGTGLGEALLIWDGVKHRPIPSEGGHCDFAARNDREITLLQHLRLTLRGRVSWERVVSGIGIQNVYKFLRDVKKMEEPDWLRERMKAEDPNAVIGQCAETGESALCVETMAMFASAYGAEAGNLALKVLATGGVYLGGGIAPKSLKTLQAGGFMQAFLDKGRLTPMLEAMPVRVILDQSCALMGAAAYAEARAAEITGRSERAASVKS